MSHRFTPRRMTAVLAACVVAAAAASPGNPAAAAAVPGPAVAPGPTAEAPGRPDPDAAAPAAIADTTVTLLTGDRVRVTAGRITTEPGEGRERVGFTRYTERGDTYVVPVDAVPSVASGRVDRRLFNITQLVRHGYDDRSRSDLPLIVTRTGAATGRTAVRAAALPGARLVRDLAGAGASAVRAQKAGTARLWAAVGQPAGGAQRARSLSPGVARVMLDGPVRATLDRSVRQIGAPGAWAAGHTGRGVKVAIVDSGVDVTHPDLADAVTAAADFTGSRSGPDDQYGHGTHVASIVTGSGVAHARGYAGVAPDAVLLNAKVLDDDGGSSESTVMAGMQWAVARGATIVNLSLGLTFAADGSDPLSAEVDRLSAQSGALFVVAAGNDGPRSGTIGSPAAAESALTVGAVDGENALAHFSSRGPRYFDHGVKPDITAPGVGIVAALAHGPAEGPYIAHDGTSMAAPHVAGAAAILAGQHPGWTGAQLKAALMGSAVPGTSGVGAPATVYEGGAGRVDLTRAVTQAVRSTTPAVHNGVVRWPHTDDTPIAKPVTYANDGPAAVTLELSVDVRDPSGAPAPPGMVAVDPARLTVPAGGRATAVVTTDTRVPAPLGVYGGILSATGPDGVRVRTPVGFDVQDERYTIDVSVRDRNGAPTGEYWFRFTDLDSFATFEPYNPSGSIAVRLPKGRYRFESLVRTPIRGRDATDLVIGVEPELRVDHDQALTLDSTRARPVALHVERDGARTGSATLNFDSTAGADTVLGYSWFGDKSGFGDVYVRPSTTSAPGRFRFSAEAKLAQPSPDGEFRSSPYLYNLRAEHDGSVPAGLVRTFADGDLAAVHSTLAAAAPGRTGVRGLVRMNLPSTLTEYYTPGHPWYADLTQYSANGRREHGLWAPVRVYQRGEVTSRQWNAAVFGPSLPPTAGRAHLAERFRGQLSLNVPMFGDGSADHAGFTEAISERRTTLYRIDQPGGESIVGESHEAGSGYFAVPAEPGRYRLRAVLGQHGAVTSTRTVVDWTFSSAPETGGAPAELPLLAVRFTPPLDLANTAPAGAPYRIPVAVQRNGGGLVARDVQVTVDASYDDGKTWQPAVVTLDGERWTATLEHPAGAGFVSLRASARDAAGSAVQQTVIRAYALR